MLVITQQEGEILEIGGNIRIMIRRVKGGWVRLCIDAPREVAIQRIVPDELKRAKQGEDAEDAEPHRAAGAPPREVTPQEVVVRRRRPAGSARGG